MPDSQTNPEGTTRYLETKEGVKSYTEVATAIAPKLNLLYKQILQGKYNTRPITEAIICDLHSKLCEHLYDWAGKWRDCDVTVGTHTPPSQYKIPAEMRQYVGDLEARLAHHEEGLEAETLAFAEWKFVHIHPFNDFNGRMSRLITAIVANQLGLPPVIFSTNQNDQRELFDALRAADKRDLAPLTNIWREQLTKALSDTSQLPQSRTEDASTAENRLKDGRPRTPE